MRTSCRRRQERQEGQGQGQIREAPAVRLRGWRRSRGLDRRHVSGHQRLWIRQRGGGACARARADGQGQEERQEVRLQNGRNTDNNEKR
eukprot:scaffold139462_cov31-Tisochrysis_lutea.AAC.3